MMRATGSRSVISKDVVPYERRDPWVKIVDDLKGKVEQVKLLNLNLIEWVLFPQINIDVFWSVSPDKLGGMKFVPKPDFINLFNSMIMNLRELPVFGTTGEVARCTKIMISRVHERILWLDRRYPIHAKYIHQLTRLFIEGEDVSKGFQGPRKHGKKNVEPSLYDRFHTQVGAHNQD
jgi:hypothetical protein